jgi:hypothetical protein
MSDADPVFISASGAEDQSVKQAKRACHAA